MRAFHLARVLSERPDVELTLLTFGPESPVAEIGRARVRTVAPAAPARLAGNLKHPAPDLPLQARMFLSSRMEAAVREELAGGVDVLHVTLARMGPYLGLGSGVHRHLDLVDSLSINMRTRAGTMGPVARLPFAAEARLMSRYEALLVREASSSSLVSPADRAASGLERVPVVPNGIDPQAFPFDPREGERPPVIAFFGNLGYFHNVRPAVFLAREVLPLVRDAVPDAELLIVGARPGRTVRALAATPGVSVRADVPDIAHALRSASIAVLPMFSGSGLKNKLLEALSVGLPVVANAAGVEGVEGAKPGIHYLAGESASEMADAAIGLLRDDEARAAIGRAGRDLVVSKYSWERQGERMLGLYAGRPR